MTVCQITLRFCNYCFTRQPKTGVRSKDKGRSSLDVHSGFVYRLVCCIHHTSIVEMCRRKPDTIVSSFVKRTICAVGKNGSYVFHLERWRYSWIHQPVANGSNEINTLVTRRKSMWQNPDVLKKKRHIYTQGAHLQAWSFFGKVGWCSKGGSEETCSNNVTQLSVLREVEKHMVTIKRDVPERWKSVVLEIWYMYWVQIWRLRQTHCKNSFWNDFSHLFEKQELELVLLVNSKSF